MIADPSDATLPLCTVDCNLFIYQARESSLVPAGFLTDQFLQFLAALLTQRRKRMTTPPSSPMPPAFSVFSNTPATSGLPSAPTSLQMQSTGFDSVSNWCLLVSVLV